MVFTGHPCFIWGVPSVKGFIEFLKSKKIRGNLIMAAVGLAIVTIGMVVIQSQKVSFFVSLAGTVLVITAFHEMMNKVPKE